MKSDLKVIVATVYGEAASQSSASWRAVAFSIVNRYGFREWRGKSYSKICKEGYDAAKDNTGLYSRAMREMNSGKMSSVVKKIYDVVKPIYDGTDIDDTGRTTFYYSPKAQAALHKTNPAKYPSVLPWILRGGRDKLFERVYIEGTESDDFAWYRYKGDGSTLKVKVENLDDQSKSENKIKATVKNGSNAFTKEYTSGSDGSVPHIHARKGSLVTFEVNDLECQKKLTADGKPKKVTLQSVNCTFKSTTEVHKGKPETSNKQSELEPLRSDSKSKSDKTVEFSIQTIEADTGKGIPSKYYLKYKGNQKPHSTDDSGIESGIKAEAGNSIDVIFDDDDGTQQTIKTFNVTSALDGQTVKVKIPVVSMELKLTWEGKPLAMYEVKSTYRGNTKKKRTNAQGVIKLNALAGQRLSVSTLHGEKIISRIVTKGKDAWSANVKSQTIQVITPNSRGVPQAMDMTVTDHYSSRFMRSNRIGYATVVVPRGVDLFIRTKHGKSKHAVTGGLTQITVGKSTAAASVSSPNIPDIVSPPKVSTPKSGDKTGSSTTDKSDKAGKDVTPKITQTKKRDEDGHPVDKVQSDFVKFTVQFLDKKTQKGIEGYGYIIKSKKYGKKNHSAKAQGKKTHTTILGDAIEVYINKDGKESRVGNFSVKREMATQVYQVEKPKLEPSGAMWTKRFMHSKSTKDLVEPFKTNVEVFIAALRKAGATVYISTTHRPIERSYLMYYAAIIASDNKKMKNKRLKPSKVPKWPGVNIDWTHSGNDAKAIQGARDMLNAYGIGKNPVAYPSRSNHNPNPAKAIDMTIKNYVGKTIVLKGKSFKLKNMNDLKKAGASISVHWFGWGDKPHWSVNGR